ncbi:hypothetical protein ACSTHB_23555, partial [Vibrio parahaemolyticus]
MAQFVSPLPLAYDAVALDGHDLIWLAREASKPGRTADAEAWTIQAAPGWSRNHLELTPDQAAIALLDRLAALLAPAALPATRLLLAHR